MDPPWGQPEPLDRKSSPRQNPGDRTCSSDYASSSRQTPQGQPGNHGSSSSPRQAPWGQPEPVDHDTSPGQAQRARRQPNANQCAAVGHSADQMRSTDIHADQRDTPTVHDTANRLSASRQSMHGIRDRSNELGNAPERRPSTAAAAAYLVQDAWLSQEGQYQKRPSSLHRHGGGSTAVQQKQSALGSDASTDLSSQEQGGRNAKANKPIPVQLTSVCIVAGSHQAVAKP